VIKYCVADKARELGRHETLTPGTLSTKFLFTVLSKFGRLGWDIYFAGRKQEVGGGGTF
jgi:hypothetical protein